MVSNATPLLALDAVVLDSETTGLDPAKARIVEIGAVRLAGGRILPESSFRSLVKPGEPIPAAVAQIHGIDDAKVASAPSFTEVWPQLSAFVGDAVWIGHAIGFDLAILKRECERADLAWVRPRILDTRLLAQVAEPNFADYTLENLAAWLDVELSDRHSALGDATTTARIFRALVPKLREGGIRTFGEATQICRTLIDVLDEQHRVGWVEAIEPPARVDTERTLRRIDSFPYRHRVGDVMRHPPEFIAANVAARDALARMMRERISSLFVCPAGAGTGLPRASEAGIVTERDLLRALADQGAEALDRPVDGIMSLPLATVRADAFVYRAIGRMSRLEVRHLGVVDEFGHLVGAISARDLLRLRAGEAISLGDEIVGAEDAHDLAVAWAKLPHVAGSLIAEGVSGRNIAAVISNELCALTRAAAMIAERRMQKEGLGGLPCPYAFAVLGSGGRGESLLALDQDNALVFSQGTPDGIEDRWFEAFARHVADILHEVGVPYCKGGVMARNPQWRGSVAIWQARIANWISRSRPQDLLSVDIFFDLRPVHGDPALGTALWRDGFAAARGNFGFAKLLAEAAGAVAPGIGLFGGFKTDNGRINLKKAGLFGVVTAARALAVCHHVLERSTRARLAGITALELSGGSDLDALTEAQDVFLDLIVAQQIEDIECGLPATNAVAVKRLSRRDRDRLRFALEAVRHIDTLTHDLLFVD